MQAQTQTQTPNNITNGCFSLYASTKPLILLFLILLMTTSATAMLSAAIMTDHWEHVTWNANSLDKITNNSMEILEWVLHGKVGILHKRKRSAPIFLVPMHGGIWTLCIDLTPSEMLTLKRYKKFPLNTVPCVSYLDSSVENGRFEEKREEWKASELQAALQPHLRMQNLSISCSLVCMIILGCAAIVGVFGLCKTQISAILITGIMYSLAALFAIFTLTIIHYKRKHGRTILDSGFKYSTVDGMVGASTGMQFLLSARVIQTSWSLDLGWCGVVLCSITSILWILLSKILR